LVRALDLEKLINAFVLVDWHWLLLGCLASAVFVSLRITKWRELTRENGLHASRLEITYAALFALALGLVTPARVGEVAVVAPFPPVARRKAIFTHAYDRVCELFAVLLFCLPAAFLFLGWVGLLLGIGVLTVYALGIAGAASLAWRTRFSRSLPFRKTSKLQAVLTSCVATSLRYWILSLANFLVAYTLVIFFIVGIEPIDNWQAIFILPVVTLSNLVSITVGGLGVREGLAAALSPRVGLSPEVAAAAFFLSFFWTRLIPGVIGLLWTVLRTEHRSNLMAALHKFSPTIPPRA
jgi:uncharacterized membrane protein YbhN (UPF0104 family)